MGIFGKVGAFLKREAKDLGDAAEDVKQRLDEELTKSENVLKMTPSEKIAALQQEASATDVKLEAIADKARDRKALADAAAALPNINHIVLPEASAAEDLASPHEASAAEDLASPPEASAAEDLASAPEASAAEDLASPSEASAAEDLASAPEASAAEDLASPSEASAAEDLASPHEASAAEDLASPHEASAAEDLASPHEASAAEDLASPHEASAAEDLASAPEASAAEEGTIAAGPVRGVASDPSDPDYGKTPAQVKYERARAAANELLDQLRGELESEGEI